MDDLGVIARIVPTEVRVGLGSNLPEICMVGVFRTFDVYTGQIMFIWRRILLYTFPDRDLFDAVTSLSNIPTTPEGCSQVPTRGVSDCPLSVAS